VVDVDIRAFSAAIPAEKMQAPRWARECPRHNDMCYHSTHRHTTTTYCVVRLLLKCDGTRAETRFRLWAKRTSPLKSAGASVLSTTGSRGAGISGSNADHVPRLCEEYWLPTPFASFPFTYPPVRHRVPSHFNWTLPQIRFKVWHSVTGQREHNLHWGTLKTFRHPAWQLHCYHAQVHAVLKHNLWRVDWVYSYNIYIVMCCL